MVNSQWLMVNVEFASGIRADTAGKLAYASAAFG
jgi:hypothetical protein